MIADNIAQYIAMNAIRRPERAALIGHGRRLDYRQLERAMLGVAAALQEWGVRRGEIVGVAMRDDIDHVVTMFAIARLGAILLPMDARWTAVETQNVARHFDARVVVTSDTQSSRLPETPVIVFDAAMLEHDIESLRLPADSSADDPLLLSLSSGTTGTPKGPILSHRQMLLRHYTEWLALGFLQSDVNLCATPLYFGGGRGFTLSYLMAGGTVVLHPPPHKPEDLAESITAHGVTTTFLVPTLLRRIAASPERIRAAFRGLRVVVSSGSALHPTERATLFAQVNAHIVNLYASTEGGSVSVLEADATGLAASSVGRPVLGSVVEIASEAGQPLPRGETGLIRHRAPWHPTGFHRNPEETKRFFRDGWYYPGDIGFQDVQGYVHITGRSKDMIIRGGVNIYPDEIEAVLLSHPGIADAAVVGRDSAILGEEVVAFIVPSGSCDAADLTEHCRRSLAAYKIPSAFLHVPELPRNPGGKVKKAELRERLARA